MNFNTLIKCEALKNYKFAEVIQIILYKKEDKTFLNYFTHINFSSSFSNTKKQEYLTNCPKSINSKYQIIITKEIISKKDILDILQSATQKQKWEWNDNISSLDNVFPVNLKFIPETDPTGNKITDSTLVPIELSLYGSNFSGGYYLYELFSSKHTLNSHLSLNDKKNIQKIINDVKLNFNLENLFDRIGNIVCKIPMLTIKHKPLKLSPELGIEGQFILNNYYRDPLECILQIIIENDHTIINTKIEEIIFSKENPQKKYCIKPNRYLNKIILSDKKTGIIYYSAVRDYSFGSDYYSIITPPNYVVKSSSKRKLMIDGMDKEIDLDNIIDSGNTYINKEVYEEEKRQYSWVTNYEYKHYFFRSFINGQENEAIQTIISICNDNELLWDLKEIWLVDPYLSSEDILKTVVYCKKYGIKIKCLTHISSINSNLATRTDTAENQTRFIETVNQFNQVLDIALSNQKDMKLEFRTVAGMNGISFHDRYLILKYNINKPRVWSLGISINSLGKSHHIIQIVHSPTKVIEIIDSIWEKSNIKECLIYKN